MQNTKYILNIVNPCQQNWEEMTLTDKGKFCANCNKNVTDFTQFTDHEIYTFFKRKKNTNICGRFLDIQLNRELSFYQKKILIYQFQKKELLHCFYLQIQIILLAKILNKVWK